MSNNERIDLIREVKLHTALNTHVNILEFLGHASVELGSEDAQVYIPGMYMLLEHAAGGDLFDKIGKCCAACVI